MSGLGAHGAATQGVAGDPHSAIHRLDPRAKLLGLVGVTMVAVSTPLAAWPVWVLCAAALVAVAAVARVPPRVIWRRSRLVLPLVLFVAAFVPFARSGGATHPVGPFEVSEEGLATWIRGILPALDVNGNEHVYGQYALIRATGPVSWDVIATGLAHWTETTHNFDRVSTDAAAPTAPIGGMAFRFTSNGAEHVYFENLTRIRTTAAAVTNRQSYEAFSPLLPGTAYIERDADGRIV